MQTIPIGARVMVSPEFRYVYEGDDAHWTGVIVDFDNNDGAPLLLVRFDDKNEWWHVAVTLVVLS